MAATIESHGGNGGDLGTVGAGGAGGAFETEGGPGNTSGDQTGGGGGGAGAAGGTGAGGAMPGPPGADGTFGLDQAGGIGGTGGSSDSGGSGGGGGGNGFVIAPLAPLTIANAATGGRGGDGGAAAGQGVVGSGELGAGGGGGSGGYGTAFTAQTQVTAAANLTGGTGGTGGTDTNYYLPYAGDGGDGGGGAYFGAAASGASFIVNVGVSVTGGVGGTGGSPGGSNGNGGAGGTGGSGVIFIAQGSVTNAGTLQGGNGGGNGGNGTVFNGGGNGTSNTIDNTGTIAGGNGQGTSGGAGVVGSNLVVDASASTSLIEGGFANLNSTGARADAIDFIGGANALRLGGTLSGNVGVDGVGTTLNFDQSANATLANVITGTGAVIDSGAGTLTLAGANTYTGGTALNGGTLDLGQQSSAGTGAITFGAGAAETLQIDADDGTLGASVAGFAANDVIDLSGLNANGATASYDGTTLTVTSGATTEAIAITAAPSGEEYVVSADTAHGGGTDVTLAAIPSPVITAPTNGTDMNNPEPTISGTGESGDTVTLTASSNGTTFIAGATVTNGIWSISPQGALPDGTYTATATESSPSGTGMSGPSNTDTFTIDTTAPTVAITSQGGPTNQASQTITGTVDTADAGTTVSLFDNGGTTAIGTGVVQKNGTWTASVTLAQGTNTLVAKDTDAVGNTGISNTVAYTLDTTAPTITSDTALPAMGDLGASKTVTFALATSEAVTVTGTPTLSLNDGGGSATYDAAASSSTSLVFTTTIAAGQNAATLAVTGVNLPNGATIRDAAGNSANLAGADTTFNGLEVDTTPPAVSSPTLTVAQNSGPTPIGIAAPSDNLTPAGSLAIVAGALPSDGTITLADGTTAVTSGETLTAVQLTGLEFTPTAGVFDQGSTFAYSATDGAGNAATGTAALDIGAAGAPTIAGTHATTDTAEAPVVPFGGVTLADPSQGTETLAIVLRNGGGTLLGDGLFVKPDGSYTLSGSAATVTQELGTLSFTPTAPPPGTSATTTFVLSDTSSAGTSVSDAGTSVTDTAAAAPTPTPTPTPVAPDTISIDPNAAFIGRGTFVLTGKVSSPAGVKSVEISARVGGVDGVETDLGSATVNANGTFTFEDKVGPNVQGFITATETDDAGGTASDSPLTSLQAGIQGKSYQALQEFYTSGGEMYAASAFEMNDGHRTVTTKDNGQTLTSQFYDTFANQAAADTTFVFDPGYGHDTIENLLYGGPNHDTVELPSSDFASFAQVLRDTQNTSSGALIHDNTSGDTLLLAGVSKGTLAQHKADFSFHA